MAVPEIVVGIDGSPAAESALKWAVAEAVRCRGPLAVVTAYEWWWPGARMVVGGEYAEAMRQQAQSLVDTAVQRAHILAPDVSVQGRTVHGQPGRALVEASCDAGVIVVGSRGRGGFGSLLLGSVGHQVATHATCPVVVARGRVDAGGPIVVGVDGSASADHAFGAAFELARTRGDRLVAVRAYEPYATSWVPGAAPFTEDLGEREKVELDLLHESVNPWRDKYPDVRVESVVHQGHPAYTLAGMSRSASLVVVGTRGHGGFGGLLLGSVGLSLLHHADCPVMVDRVRANA